MNDDKEKYLVAYVIKRESGHEDMFMTYDTLAEAMVSYQDIINWTDTYSCNICKVIKSTDY